MRILILAGTAEARDLARKLASRRHDITSSLAGRTDDPNLPDGRVRMGGFGGADGMADYIASEDFELVIDATHPYAGTISAEAIEAAAKRDIPLIRFDRPAWPETDGANWTHFADIASALRAVPAKKKALVTTGQKELAVIAECPEADFLVRVIDPPDIEMPDNARLLLARPPYTLKSETDLMGRNGITHLITKNSGSTQTRDKLSAAQALGISVFMIDRPPLPEAKSVTTVEDMLDSVHDLAAASA